MKSKKLSIIVALVWFAMVGVLYLPFALVWKFKVFHILSSPPLKEQVLGSILVMVPPLCWWIPRRLLIHNGKWHRAGTITFCIGVAGLFLAGYVLDLIPDLEHSSVWKLLYDPFAVFNLGLVFIFLLVCEAVFVILHLIFKKS